MDKALCLVSEPAGEDSLQVTADIINKNIAVYQNLKELIIGVKSSE